MLKFVVAALLAVVTYTLSGCGQLMPSAASSSSSSLSARTVLKEDLLVKFKAPVSASSVRTFHAQHGTRTVRVIPGVNVHVVSITSGRSMAQVLEQMSQSPMVEYVEPNHSINLNDDPTLI